MSGMTTGNVSLLTRAEVWSNELKMILEEDLLAQGFVKMLTEFPDGDEFKIPSIGDARTDDYSEDTAVKYRPLDTGQFQFSITEYKSSGTYITKKAEQDMYYMNELVSSFVPKQRRAILEDWEAHVLERPEAAYSANQQAQINIKMVEIVRASAEPGGTTLGRLNSSSGISGGRVKNSDITR